MTSRKRRRAFLGLLLAITGPVATASAITLQPPLRFSSSPSPAAFAPIDGDGLLDALTKSDAPDGTFIFAVQGPRGVFTRVDLRTTEPEFGSWPAIADLAGDDRPDLLLAFNRPNETFFVFPRTGPASFGAATATALNLQDDHVPVSVAMGDVTGDGRADVVIATAAVDAQGAPRPPRVVILSKGAQNTPTVVASVPLTVGATTVRIELADVTADGIRDVVTGGPAGGVVLSRADGFMQRSFLPGVQLRSLAIADVNLDSSPDVVSVEGPPSPPSGPEPVGTLRLRLSGPAGGLGEPLPLNSGLPAPGEVAAGDVNGDGAPDLLVSRGRDSPVDPEPGRTVIANVLAGDGTGAFAAPQNSGVTFADGFLHYAPRLVDLDGDGRSEVVFGNFDSSTVIYMNDTAFAPLVCSRPSKSPNCPPPPRPPDPCTTDCPPPPCAAACPVEDRTPPVVTAGGPRRLALGRPIEIVTGCSEACLLTAQARIEVRTRAGSLVRVATLPLGVADLHGPRRTGARIRFDLRGANLRMVRSSLRAGRRVVVRAIVGARDDAGNQSAARTISIRLA